ncbi:MAG: chemotaxis protein CheW [Campylobacterales bacterium]|nr:chemotaxis protein CheW [Campylobacterales bacterium]
MQLIIFTVSSQRYAIPLGNIREILTYTGFTKLPDSQPWVVGLIETRGQAMPIIDLRIRFETNSSPSYHDKTIIIATKLSNKKLLGLLVDTVEDIQNVDESVILLAEGIESGLNSQLLQGYIQNNGNSILILNHEVFGVLNNTTTVIEERGVSDE